MTHKLPLAHQWNQQHLADLGFSQLFRGGAGKGDDGIVEDHFVLGLKFLKRLRCVSGRESESISGGGENDDISVNSWGLGFNFVIVVLCCCSVCSNHIRRSCRDDK